jgi:hypothetical protein
MSASGRNADIASRRAHRFITTDDETTAPASRRRPRAPSPRQRQAGVSVEAIRSPHSAPQAQGQGHRASRASTPDRHRAQPAKTSLARRSLDCGLCGEIAAGNRRHRNTRQNIAGIFPPIKYRPVSCRFIRVLKYGSKPVGPKSRTINPMRLPRYDADRLNAAPRCAARSKRSGERCRGPAIRGKRMCRMHGAGGGAPAGKSNGRYRHGCCTKAAIFLMRDLNLMARLLKRLPR